MEGKPLLSGAAFGATPLLWVACRAQPCMIHLFCDTQLQVTKPLSIFSFSKTKLGLRILTTCVFIARISGAFRRIQCSCLSGKGRIKLICWSLLAMVAFGFCHFQSQKPVLAGNLKALWPSFISIWRDCKFGAKWRRPAKKRKTQKVGEIQRIQPRPTNLELGFVGASNEQTTWKKLAAESYRLRASEVKNVVVADSLLGTVPGATVAAFGPNNHVCILCLPS